MKLLYKTAPILAVALVMCLLPMPYGYFTLIRFVSMIFFGCLAVTLYKEEKANYAVTAGVVALLFQPFCKIALGRGVWNAIDVIAAATLLTLWYKYK